MKDRCIFIIRHAEKPPEGMKGIDAAGELNEHSLIPIGKQRAEALTTLFTGDHAWFHEPTELIVAAHDGDEPEHNYRPYQTLVPLAERIKRSIAPTKEDDETLAERLSKAAGGMTLISWAHEDIPALAKKIPTPDAKIPRCWPDDRFDLVWVFERTGRGKFAFSQVPQMLLPGDRYTPIYS
jgi:hypothetical protein